MSNYITLSGFIKGETEKAINFEGVWIPKSQIKNMSASVERSEEVLEEEHVKQAMWEHQDWEEDQEDNKYTDVMAYDEDGAEIKETFNRFEDAGITVYEDITHFSDSMTREELENQPEKPFHLDKDVRKSQICVTTWFYEKNSELQNYILK